MTEKSKKATKYSLLTKVDVYNSSSQSGFESVNFQRCFLVVKRSKMDGFWIFKKPDKPIYISSYAGSMKNVDLRLFEPTVKLRSGQSLRLGSKSEI